jgi:hypothetical protein
MTTIRLDPTTCTNFHGTTSYGSTTWSDGSDSTYVEMGVSAPIIEALGVIPAYTGPVPFVGMSFHLRASCTGPEDGLLIYEMDRPSHGRIMWSDGGSDLGRESFLVGTTGGPVTDPKMDWLIPNDGVIRTYSVPVTNDTLDNNGWDHIEAGGFDPSEVGGEVANAGNMLYIWADDHQANGPFVHDTCIIRVYEAWLEIQTTDGPLPLRLHPRDDGQGTSTAARNYPSPKPTSARTSGGTYT